MPGVPILLSPPTAPLPLAVLPASARALSDLSKPTISTAARLVNQQNNVDNHQHVACHAGMEMQTGVSRSFQHLRQRSLVVEVRDELERMILQGELAAGSRLNENRIAEQLGVSRGPVREAARSLEREGLATTIANQGVFVRDLSLEDALELYDLRAMIAGHLCGAAAKYAAADGTAILGEYINQMDRAIRAGDEQRYFALNLAFHDQVALISRTTRSRQLYASLGKEVRLLRLRVLSGEAALKASNIEHARIVNAIERGDAKVARLEGAQHHMNGKQRLLERL